MALLQQIRRNGTAVATGDETRRETALVELNRHFSLFAFCTQVGMDGFKYVYSDLPSDLCNEKIAMLFGIAPVSGRVVRHLQIEEVAHSFDRPRVSHLDTERENVGVRSLPAAWTRSLDCDAAFAINKSSKVSQLSTKDLMGRRGHLTDSPFVAHRSNGRMNWIQKQGLPQQKSANSVNTRPLKTRATPSQTFITKEVCREHIRTPKGMTCSDLRSNAKRTAEMTVPGNPGRVTKVQDAKTAQILWMGTSGVTNRRKHGVLSDINTTLTS